jgi:hypothetical protein
MRRLAASIALSLMLAAPAFAASTDAAVVISNQSSWQIHELYISSVDTEEWGPDQLGEKVIGTDEEFTLHSIPCDAYDVRLVDEDGDECVVNAVALCADKDAWVIQDSDLLACQAETE